MNILYVTFSFNVGGIERLLVDIVNNMAEHTENNVFLCIINNKYDKNLLNEISKKANIVILDRQEKSKNIRYMISYIKLVIKNKIDIIHCQMENAVKMCIPIKLLKPQIIIITTVHDTNIFNNLKYYEVLVDRLICSRIIAISDVVKQEILSRNIPDKKVIRIYNAVDLKKFSVNNSHKNKLNSNFIIGNVSRIIPRKKGQDLLIEAISKIKDEHPNIMCLLAGAEPENEVGNIESLKRLAEKLGVSNNVVFLGNVNDVSSFLNNIDIFVLPSRYEGFGISLIEAMSKGIPCIASNIDGPKEIIKNNKYGLLFETENSDDLAVKIKYRIKNMGLNKKNIKRYIKRNFDIKYMIRRLLKLYDSLI